jgi:hypothetical protein
MTTSSAPAVRADRPRVAARPAALAVLAATLAAVLVWFVAVPLGGADVRVTQGGSEIGVGVGAVLATATVAGLLGWALLGVLSRTVGRPVTVWRAVAVVALVLSLGGPLSSGAGAASVAVLVVLHVAVAAVLVPLLPRAVQGR